MKIKIVFKYSLYSLEGYIDIDYTSMKLHVINLEVGYVLGDFDVVGPRALFFIGIHDLIVPPYATFQWKITNANNFSYRHPPNKVPHEMYNI